MSSVNRDLRGTFINALRELVPTIQPHQVEAANDPKRPTKSLAGKHPPAKRRCHRHVNDRLACRKPKD